MTTQEFCELSTLEMNIEVLETEAYNYSCEAKNEFTINGNSDTYKMYARMYESLAYKIKDLKS